MPNDSNTESNHSAASQNHATLILPRTKKRYRLSAYHCAISLTETEVILYPVGADGWQSALNFITDNCPEREALKVLAGLESA